MRISLVLLLLLLQIVMLAIWGSNAAAPGWSYPPESTKLGVAMSNFATKKSSARMQFPSPEKLPYDEEKRYVPSGSNPLHN